MSLANLFEEFGAIAFDDVAFTDIDSFLDHLLEINDGVIDISLIPTTFKFCRKNYMKKPSATDIVSQACEHMEAGAEEPVDIDGLQTLIDYWYKHNAVFEYESFGEEMPLSEEIRQEILAQFETDEEDTSSEDDVAAE
jgi:hypothetical protein